LPSSPRRVPYVHDFNLVPIFQNPVEDFEGILADEFDPDRWDIGCSPCVRMFGDKLQAISDGAHDIARPAVAAAIEIKKD
jgi:hypothetical protein